VFVTGDATILHADLDAFYASVEQRDDPRLRGRPVIVGGGVVLAASYEAKAFGVRTAMAGAQARQLCPWAVVVEPRMSAYSAASDAAFEVFERTTPLVEGLSIDEAFLDVGGLLRVSGTATEIATRLRRDILERVGLPITVGVARTKFLAKVASGVAKPDGLLVVLPDRELDFLHPLPVERLWGVGPVTARKLHQRGLTTVGEVAALDEAALIAMLGPAAARHLHALAHNGDPRPVQAGRRRRSIGSQHALGRGPKSAADLDASLVGLVDRVTRRLRAAGRVGRTVVLRLRFDDFSRVSRSHTLAQATACTHTIVHTARELLHAAMPTIARRGITLVGVAVANLDDDDTIQLALPFDRLSDGALDAALDDVRDRFGAPPSPVPCSSAATPGCRSRSSRTERTPAPRALRLPGERCLSGDDVDGCAQGQDLAELGDLRVVHAHAPVRHVLAEHGRVVVPVHADFGVAAVELLQYVRMRRHAVGEGSVHAVGVGRAEEHPDVVVAGRRRCVGGSDRHRSRVDRLSAVEHGDGASAQRDLQAIGVRDQSELVRPDPARAAVRPIWQQHLDPTVGPPLLDQEHLGDGLGRRVVEQPGAGIGLGRARRLRLGVHVRLGRDDLRSEARSLVRCASRRCLGPRRRAASAAATPAAGGEPDEQSGCDRRPASSRSPPTRTMRIISPNS
jgi:DNA polymerase-4